MERKDLLNRHLNSLKHITTATHKEWAYKGRTIKVVGYDTTCQLKSH